jgi:hypothetical protein
MQPLKITLEAKKESKERMSLSNRDTWKNPEGRTKSDKDRYYDKRYPPTRYETSHRDRGDPRPPYYKDAYPPPRHESGSYRPYETTSRSYPKPLGYISARKDDDIPRVES